MQSSKEYKTGNAISLNNLILRDLEILAYTELSSNCFYDSAFITQSLGSYCVRIDAPIHKPSATSIKILCHLFEKNAEKLETIQKTTTSSNQFYNLHFTARDLRSSAQMKKLGQ